MSKIISVEESEKLRRQQVGAFGERIVEAELLRRGWITANVNASIKNAKDHDLWARQGSREVSIRVKTCAPGQKHFQIGGFRRGERIDTDIGDQDFTVLVKMGQDSKSDDYYIVPTRVVRQELEARRQEQSGRRKRDGSEIKDIGKWNLILPERKDGQIRAGEGLERKWARYRDNWDLLNGER